MFLKPYVQDKKGLQLQCYTRHNNRKCVIYGYLDNIEFYIPKYVPMCTITLTNATIYTSEINKSDNDIIYTSLNGTLHCAQSCNLDKTKYTIYPSKREIQAKLTKISANLMNKVMNYL